MNEEEHGSRWMGRLRTVAAALAAFVVLSAQAATSNLVLNPGFESGSSGWTMSSTGNYVVIYTDGAHAHSGNGYAWIGGDASSTDTISQDVTIASDVQQAYVQFWYEIATQETSTTAADTMQVTVTDLSSGATSTLASFSNLNATTGWAQSGQLDVTPYRGRTVRLSFSGTSNTSLNTNFFIDDVSLVAVASSVSNPVRPFLGSGYHRTCAIDRNGAPYCWGDTESGALGDGRSISYTNPQQVNGLTSGVAVLASSPSSYHTCAVTAAGQALCWGENGDGQLGNGTIAPSTVPTAVQGLGSGVASIATGAYHTCALTVAGGVLCWGDNFYGQLGNGTASAGSSVPVQVAGLGSGIRALALGAQHTCALTTSGGVMCWGDNVDGQLGNGTTTASAMPVMVSGLSSGVAAITAGFYHTCALKTSGGVACWGRNGSGQLGDGSSSGSSTPQPVSGLSGIAQIAAGGYHTCAISGSGALFCWGFNNDGELGNGTTASSTVPVAVSGLGSGVRSISLGWAHSCAFLNAGGVECWGYNGAGQFGNGTQTGSSTPTPATSLTASIVAIVAGDLSTCAVTTQGGALCWGSNQFFQLGLGQSIGVASPTPVTNISSGASTIGSGSAHTCALMQAGEVYCWGSDVQGQLGNGKISASSSYPVQVALSASATALAVGHDSNCAITAATGAVCWGANTNGGLGDGTTIDRSSPVAVSGLASGVAAIGAGSLHACALTVTGSVYCWGYNASGQLGNGNTTDHYTPSPVAGLSGIAAIAVGGWHNCALTSTGGVLCWGDNGQGRLGDGTTSDRSTPTQVAGLASGVVQITAGWYHTCALTSAGAVLCWGYNYYGQLGDGSTTNSAAPVRVAGLPSGVVAISAGTDHTCALTNVGTLYCWGYNSTGGLGDSTFADRTQPTVAVHAGGTGSLATNDWFLDLDPGISKTIPADKIPVFLVNASGNAATALVSTTASVSFRASDVGNPIYVFGYVPASLVKGARLRKDDNTCVLAQLSSSGVPQAVSSSSLQGYVSNVTTTQGQAITVLNNVMASNVAGATFCVGTAAAGGDAVGAGNSRCVATVPPASSTDPICLPPGAVVNSPGALSGLWWNSGESGWGIHFTQRRNVVFAAWYTYDASGNPKWYVASDCAMPAQNATSGTCSGTLYEVNGPTFFGTAFNPSLVNVVAAGSLSVNFADANNASMSYTVGGQSRTVAITRQPISSGAAPPAVDYTDLWWNPNESGWGLAIAQQYNVMFLAWYVYDNLGRPMWYVASDCAVSGSGCTGALYRTTGPALGPSFDPSRVSVFAVGSVTLSFTDPNNGTLTYTVDGVSGSKAITRQLF